MQSETLDEKGHECGREEESYCVLDRKVIFFFRIGIVFFEVSDEMEKLGDDEFVD